MNIKKQTFLLYLYDLLISFRLVDAVWVLFLLDRGYSLAQVGIAEGVFHITSMLFEVPSGMFADLFGRKKTLLLSGMAGILSSFFMALDGWSGWIYFGMICSALAFNLASGTQEAIVYDSLLEGKCEDRYKKVWANMSVIGRVAQAAACAASPIAIAMGYRYTYLVMGILGCGTVLSAAGMKEPVLNPEICPESLRSRATEGESIEKNTGKTTGKVAGKISRADDRDIRADDLWDIIKKVRQHIIDTANFIREHPRTMCKLLADAAVACPCYLLMMYLQNHLVECGWPKAWIGMPILLIPLAGAIGAWIAAKNKSSLFRAMLVCGIAGGIGTCLAGSKILLVTLSGACIARMCEGFSEITVSENTNREFTSEQRATLVSIDSMFYSVLMVVASPLTGVIGNQYSTSAVFFVLGGTLLGATVLLGLVFGRNGKKIVDKNIQKHFGWFVKLQNVTK